jgi:hypothetical protein
VYVIGAMNAVVGASRCCCMAMVGDKNDRHQVPVVATQVLSIAIWFRKGRLLFVGRTGAAAAGQVAPLKHYLQLLGAPTQVTERAKR